MRLFQNLHHRCTAFFAVLALAFTCITFQPAPAYALGNIPLDILNNNDAGVNSLRDIIETANGVGLTSIVEGTYAANLDGSTITITSAPLPTLSGLVSFNATGLANGITVTGLGWAINSSVSFTGKQTFAIDISGTGSIIQDGAGQLTLTGHNTYSGGTSITNLGTIAINNSSALGTGAVSLISSGKLKFLNDMVFTNTIRLNNAGYLTTDAAHVVINAAMTNDGATPGGLIKNGTGTIILNGVNTYSGLTSISQGTLQIGDETHTTASITSFVINNSTLSGFGTVNGDVGNVGTVSPGGDTAGTLTINGTYTQDPDGTLAIRVSPTAASKLAVTGLADLNGALRVTFENKPITPGTYTILTAGSMVGTFQTVTLGNAFDALGTQLLVDAPVYSANAVQFTVRNGAAVSLGNSNSAMTTQSVNSGHRASGTIFDHLDDGDTSTQSGNDISFTSLADRTITQHENASGLNNLAKALPTAMKQYNGWFKGLGNIGSVDSNGTAAGYRNETGGFMFGVDRAIGDGMRVGVAGGYEHSDVSSFSTIASSGEANTVRLALYGNKKFKDEFSASLQIGYALHMLDSERFVPATATNARASHDAHELSFGGQVSKNIAVSQFVFTPRIGMTYLHLMEDGFTESGAGAFNMTVSDKDTDSLRMSAGLGFAAPIKNMNGVSFTPTANIKYSYEALDASRSTQGSVGITPFNLQGVAPSRHVLSMGVGFSAKLDDQLDAFGSYDAVFPTGNTFEQTFILGMKLSF